LFGGNVSYSIRYQGNFSRSKTRQFTARSGSVLFNRAPKGGLHAIGSPGDENVDELSSEVLLVDEDLDSSTGIDLSNDQFNNVGIWVSSDETVDRLYIYVNQNVTSDAALTNAANWKLYKSDFNQVGTWTEHSIAAVSVSAVNSIDNIYRYEITFVSQQTASYFKVVNMVTSDEFDVSVTEIEAYGTDVIPDTNVLERVSTNFKQGLSFSTSVKPLSNITVSLMYSLDRRDSNPVSLSDSFVGIITNIYSDEITGEKESFSSKITRSYGISTYWAAHRLLNSSVSFSRHASFDNKKSSDISSNTYRLTLNSSPLPTLSTNFVVNRNEGFSFDEKKSISDSMFVHIGSELYKGINMVSGFGFTQSEDVSSGTDTSTRFMDGTISARIKKGLSGSVGFNINWSDGVTKSKSMNTNIAYRPARRINFSGKFAITSADENISMSEGISMGWLPLPVLRIATNWQRKQSDPGPNTSDKISASGTWYFTNFADFRFSYRYTRAVTAHKTEKHSFNINFNCGF
jgi:hypothetical protein